jgi:hypothetical protein
MDTVTELDLARYMALKTAPKTMDRTDRDTFLSCFNVLVRKVQDDAARKFFTALAEWLETSWYDRCDDSEVVLSTPKPTPSGKVWTVSEVNWLVTTVHLNITTCTWLCCLKDRRLNCSEAVLCLVLDFVTDKFGHDRFLSQLADDLRAWYCDRHR